MGPFSPGSGVIAGFVLRDSSEEHSSNKQVFGPGYYKCWDFLPSNPDFHVNHLFPGYVFYATPSGSSTDLSYPTPDFGTEEDVQQRSRFWAPGWYKDEKLIDGFGPSYWSFIRARPWSETENRSADSGLHKTNVSGLDKTYVPMNFRGATGEAGFRLRPDG